MTFREFFSQTTSGQSPYAYQCRLAGGANADGQGDFRHAGACHSQLISIPTGLGKTAAVTLAWIWNRVVLDSPEWPRRLVYCLPMRTLVTQTEKEVRAWLGARLWDGSPANRRGAVGVHVLMGGEEAGEWDLYPEENAILIGTQDMLLSRALNRGYGMSRYRWPMPFGLLNNDCLWIMDETQLMGVSVETSAQLDGFRRIWSGAGRCPTWWMSATLDTSRLATVDHPVPPEGWARVELSEAEKSDGRPRDLFEAHKPVERAELALSPSTRDSYAKALATLIATHHQPGTFTLVVLNRVSRAQAVYEALTSPDRKTKQPLYDPAAVGLIHSRFRRGDRSRHEEQLFGAGDRIVIATQAVEAGVDVSARLLITELAPWSSLVQRMGRCNRRAEYANARLLWLDVQPKDDKDLLRQPYATHDLDRARVALTGLSEASSRSLSHLTIAETPVIRPVIRQRDLIDLFDTTPDICGQDLDISRYIRDDEDNDVQFFWRLVEGDTPAAEIPQAHRDELCRVSIADASKFLRGSKTRAWIWNPLGEKWEPARAARPGGVYLVDRQSGGYCDTRGWTGESSDLPTPLTPAPGENEAHADEPLTFTRSWQTLADHTADVTAEMRTIVDTLAEASAFSEALLTAARWHDVGKAHGHFQQMLADGPHPPPDPATVYAKSANPPGRRTTRTPYRSLRHELASALAWLLAHPADSPERDLVAYLIAAHHGKVRLSIRSLPEESGDPAQPERLFARGIWHGDPLPALELPGVSLPEITLDLSFMHLGEGPKGPSWLARTLSLRDRFGPFRLAYLETLLRAADARASALAASTVTKASQEA